MRDLLKAANDMRRCGIVDDDFPALLHRFDGFLRYYCEKIPKIVCLCGSTRFKQAYETAIYEETIKGNIVLSVGCYPHARVGPIITREQKIALDELHFRKIDLADEILVLNVAGYIGESTRNEIRYAENACRIIRYLENNG